MKYYDQCQHYKDSTGYHRYPRVLKNGYLQFELVSPFHNARTTIIAKRYHNDEWRVSLEQHKRACKRLCSNSKCLCPAFSVLPDESFIVKAFLENSAMVICRRDSSSEI